VIRPNLPNSITIFRILLIPVFMAFLLGTVPFLFDEGGQAQDAGAVLAAVTFAIAAATDSLDGYVARRRRQVTVLGTFLDPLADKLLISAALIALVQLGNLSAWVAMVIIAREFAVSTLRMVSAAENVVIPASRWGKAKTVSQMVAIIVLILAPGPEVWGWSLGSLLMAVAVVLTLVSGVDYFVKALDRLPPPRAQAVAQAPAERPVGRGTDEYGRAGGEGRR
jgi:CDP-diacylglycerol--glycerol-3-phosphate 3-phosphatidyltransferase